MATTVNNAFNEFMRDTVNLDTNTTTTARSSRDNLISNISDFSGDEDFFNVYNDRNLKFGSFARRTKIRELDDIDLMICLSGDGTRTYSEDYGCIHIFGNNIDLSNGLLTTNTNYLNSTKIINRFIKKLEELSDYKKAEMHKNQEAATLNLKSYSWIFDIVPCFYAAQDFYLIPDGSGNWKKTDPRIDADRVTSINQNHNGNLLNLIRLVKYWNKRKITLTIPSYVLECMILNRYESIATPGNWYIDLQFKDTLSYLSNAILNDINDPKNIQGNINSFNYLDRIKISTALSQAYAKANEAVSSETSGDQKTAIGKWGEVLGSKFPEYTSE